MLVAKPFPWVFIYRTLMQLYPGFTPEVINRTPLPVIFVLLSPEEEVESAGVPMTYEMVCALAKKVRDRGK